LSEHALPGEIAAAALSARLGSPVLWLVHVVSDSLTAIDGGAARALKERAEKRLEEKAASLQQRTAAPVRSAILSDVASGDVQSVGEALMAFAEKQQASVLVMASQGHGASPLRRVGGTSERAAQLARVPVLVVRETDPFEAWRVGLRPLRVLLGIDRTASSEPAIRWVKSLRLAGPCDLTVTHVYYPDEKARLYGLHRFRFTEADPTVEQWIARDLERQVGTMPGSGKLVYKPKLGAGRLGDHVLEVAEEDAVDLIVVGTHGKHWLARLASVSSVVLHFGHASVACIPSPSGAPAVPDELPRLERVLIATDFSAPSNQAVAYGYTLASQRGGEVHLLHVVRSGDDGREDLEDVDIVAELRRLVPKLAEGLVTRTEVIREEDVAGAICAAAERVGADAICLGAHGRSGVKRAVLGSVAEAVMQRSSRPVLIVRPPPP
jgi:nucleotide-binding universal stress UspA family protein